MAIIIKEQGGSVLDVGSTGLARINDGASLVHKPTATTGNTVYEFLQIGNNKWYYAAGSGGSPQFSGSPGDLCWVANSASTNLWVNVSNGTTGSKWAAMRLTVAGSQVQGAV